MTDQRDQAPASPAQDALPDERGAVALPITRRMVLRGAAGAVPTILTLQSGAALANASNGWTGGASTTSGSMVHTVVEGGQPQYACLATHGGQTSGAYQLPSLDGHPVTMIPAGMEFEDPDAADGMKKVFGDDMCYRGGEFQYQVDGDKWQPVYVRQGMLMSGGSYSSLAASGVIDPKSVFTTTL